MTAVPVLRRSAPPPPPPLPSARGRKLPTRASLPGSSAPRASWGAHVAYLDRMWRPGQHCSIISPTEGGKSHLKRSIEDAVWRDARIIVIDPTEDDKNYGPPFRVVKGHPKRWQRSGHPQWYRIVPTGDHDHDRAVIEDTLRRAHGEGEFVIDIDELRKLTDARKPGWGLSPRYDDLMLRARKRKVTVIAATQEPRWVPSSFYTQSKYFYIGYVADERAQMRLAEISGRRKLDDIVTILNSLREYEFLFIGPGEGPASSRRIEIVKAPPRRTP